MIVTRNRRALLAECLDAIAGQTRPPDYVLVVDNASDDGTAEMLREQHPEVEVLSLATNQGGAGGFHDGLRAAHSRGSDWVWLMDDDTIPTPGCLAALLDGAERVNGGAPALLASKVVWSDGRPHPGNWPGFERNDTAAVVAGSELGLMPLRVSTFVSLLISRAALDAHGLPLRRYFVWSDDLEYTARILRDSPGYLVPESVAVHKTERRDHTCVTAAPERFYFHVRNTLYMLRGPAWRPSEKLSLVYVLLHSTLAYLRFNRLSPRVIPIILRGLRDGLKPGAPTPLRP